MEILLLKSNENENKLYCVNCGKILDSNDPICIPCNEQLETEKVNLTIVPIVIMMLISISLGIFIVWDIFFLDFSGHIMEICEVDYSRSFRPQHECNTPTYRNNANLSYVIEIFSDKTNERQRINFNEYPILFNRDNYSTLFRKLKKGDYISKSHFSPYYIVNEETYVLIGSPLQVILFVGIFIILIPIFLPKFIKDFISDNKHLGKIKI